MNSSSKEGLIFALDIGTRTVIGIVCRKEENKLKIVAQSMVEHDSRSMIDGQVHDIDRVSDVVMKVKAELEEKVGFNLKEVAIAAAGRALKTKCVHVEQDLGDDMDVDSAIINSLEILGVNEATGQIKNETGYRQDHFYCVGYSIVSYYLNGYTITNLLNHKGRYIGADILATFLPQSVVNSLYKVLDKCSLVPVSLTLEPIAAMEAVVPDNIRLLNIALIDIGAGTSDIAITKRGCITAYGMVPVAGDEITEAIAEEYLVDFNTAEAIKRCAGKKKKISFKDITGTKINVDAKEVLHIIERNTTKLAEEISKTILSYNGDAPRAVFCVGGGSQTPYLVENLSKELSMDKQRIAVKKRDAVLNLETCDHFIDGPEGVTVVGIALVALKRAGHDFISVYINNKEHRLFNSGDLKVYDVFSLIGYNPEVLIARSGKSISFTLNGEAKKAFGQPGLPPEILVNGNSGSIETLIGSNDRIDIKEAQNGKDAEPHIKDYLQGYEGVSYTLNATPYVIEPHCTINGKKAGYIDPIKDGDDVKIVINRTIWEQAAINGIEVEGKYIYVNGKPVSGDYIINDGDNVIITDSTDTKNNVDLENIVPQDYITVDVNGREVVLKGKDHIFVDIFNVIDFDTTMVNGAIRLMLNGKNAEYSQKMKSGDVIEIYINDEIVQL